MRATTKEIGSLVGDVDIDYYISLHAVPFLSLMPIFFDLLMSPMQSSQKSQKTFAKTKEPAN